MRKRMCLFPGMAVVLLFTILFAAGYTTPAIGNVNTVQAATKKKDISREGKKKRSIIKGKIFELEVDKPESVKDKNLTWSIKDSSIVTFGPVKPCRKFKSNVRETWRVILVREADIFLSESLRILVERLSQSRRLPPSGGE